MYVHETPPTTPQNTPFPGLNLKVGKMNYSLCNLDPNWAICLKSGQNFSREVGKKIYLWCQGTVQVHHCDPRCTATMFNLLLLFAIISLDIPTGSTV